MLWGHIMIYLVYAMGYEAPTATHVMQLKAPGPCCWLDPCITAVPRQALDPDTLELMRSTSRLMFEE